MIVMYPYSLDKTSYMLHAHKRHDKVYTELVHVDRITGGYTIFKLYLYRVPTRMKAHS